MNVILNSAHNDRLAFEIRQDTAEVTVHFLTNRFVAQKRSSFFCGKDGVNQNPRERLRHAVTMCDRRRVANPQTVGGSDATLAGLMA